MMKENSGKLFKKIMWILVTFLLLEALLILAVVSIETLGEYKLDTKLDILLEQFTETFTNLPVVISNWWQEKNPLFLIGTGIVLIYSLYVQISANKKKDSWKTEEDLGYHGTARWARKKEIFDKENFLGKSKKTIQTEFEKSLKQKEV